MREIWQGFVKEEVEQALLRQKSAFLARVLHQNVNRIDVQPLFMRRKKNGELEQPQPILQVPCLRGVEAQENEVVLCLVCDRELGAALHGEFYVPRPGVHPLSACVVLGVVAS